MRRLAIGSVLGWVFVFALTVQAQEPTAPKAGSFDALKQEFRDARKKYSDEMRAEMQAKQKEMEKAIADAKTEQEKAEVRKKFATKATSMADGPEKTFSPRFLDFAKQNAKDPQAFEALMMALQTSGGPQSKIGTWKPVLQVLQANYVAKPEIKQAVKMLARASDDGAAALLREIIAKNPDRKLQGFTMKQMIDGYNNIAQVAQQYKDNAQLRQRVEEQMGKEQLDAMIARTEAMRKDIDELQKTFKDKYADLFPDLSIGKPAPEIVTKDVDGKSATLSALKGKVVVLDVWATWCGPCRAMIPHEREMVERLKDKPFSLVSISADEELKTLTDFLAKEKMPWTHWWVGNKGGFVEDWDIQYFPTIYILDSKGVIRHKDLRGEKMEEAVVKLLEEMEKKSE